MAPELSASRKLSGNFRVPRQQLSGINSQNENKAEAALVKLNGHPAESEPSRCRRRRGSSAPMPHSGSFGLLKRTVNLMLPCPLCGKLGALGFPGSKLEAVSSGGNNTSVSRKCNMSKASPSFPSVKRLANASLDAWASPPWRRITSVKLMLRPS
jgi:hypothetical protein